MLNLHRSYSGGNASSPVENGRAELPSKIMAYASTQPEGTPLWPNALDHLGSKEDVSEAMTALAEQGMLKRVWEDVFLIPVETRFGTRSPYFEEVIPHLAKLWGETIVPCGGAAANVLGMTTQVPVRPVYLTSGDNRVLNFGGQTVELRNAPEWELVAPHRPAGNAVRALAWLGPEEAEEGIEMLGRVIPLEELRELVASCKTMPEWITGAVNTKAISA